jgi:hypothetical protein
MKYDNVIKTKILNLNLMKNLIFLLFCFLLIKTNSFSQGFVSNGTNIYLTNSAGSATVAPFPSIGIGTNTPSAQLHTRSTVRFQGIANDNAQSRVIVSDANGNLRWRDASTIGTSGTFWNLAGNSIVGTEFIGTTNSQPFIIRTNNIERLRITPSGNIGIGTATPAYKIDINDNTNSSMRFISTGGYASAFFKGQGSTDSYSFIQLLSNGRILETKKMQILN